MGNEDKMTLEERVAQAREQFRGTDIEKALNNNLFDLETLVKEIDRINDEVHAIKAAIVEDNDGLQWIDGLGTEKQQAERCMLLLSITLKAHDSERAMGEWIAHVAMTNAVVLKARELKELGEAVK